MAETTDGSEHKAAGKVVKLYPGKGETAIGGAHSSREALAAFLSAAGWSVADLTTDQLRLLAGLMTERQSLLETIRSLNSDLDHARTIADHDPLLPIFNRRAFVRELSKQLSFCRRYQISACLIYLDLDRFKALNDALGHSTGDMALKDIVRVLKSHLRESDLTGRLGGDEFAILMPGANLEAGNIKAEQFREDIQKLSFGEPPVQMSLDVSCGVVEWQDGETPDHLINRADEAMYAVKSRQRKARA